MTIPEVEGASATAQYGAPQTDREADLMICIAYLETERDALVAENARMREVMARAIRFIDAGAYTSARAALSLQTKDGKGDE